MHYNPNDKMPTRWATVATTLYVLLLLLAFWLVSFDFKLNVLKPGDGILIDFGTTEQGFGERDLSATDVEAPPQTASAPSTAEDTEYLTVKESEVEVKQTKQKSEPQKEIAPVVTPKPAEPKPVAEPTKTVNTKALFPGRTVGSTAKSEGVVAGAGNQGDPSGSPQGSHDGTGQGLSGVAYDLSGRSVVGSLPKPAYTANVSGKVIVDVTVDAGGQVTGATYHPQGSTTSNASLVAAARAAAMKARFSESESFVQGGTITYIFRMN
ncbi:MAG: TonB family protein [Alistipes sp.]